MQVDSQRAIARGAATVMPLLTTLPPLVRAARGVHRHQRKPFVDPSPAPTLLVFAFCYSPEKIMRCRVTTLTASCQTKIAGSMTLTMMPSVHWLRAVTKAELIAELT